MQNSGWYYVENGQSIGPVSDDKMHDLLNKGTINQTTMIWKEGMPNWVTVAQLLQGNTPQTSIPTTTTESANSPAPTEAAYQMPSSNTYSNYQNTAQDPNLEIYRPGALSFYILAGLGTLLGIFALTAHNGPSSGIAIIGISIVLAIIGYFAHTHAWVYIVGLVICSAAGILGVVALSGAGAPGRFIIVGVLVYMIRSFRNTSLRQKSSKR
jgi:hypothetical protein